MKHTALWALTLAAGIFATQTLAQELRGAEIDLSYGALFDEADFNKFSAKGSAEISFSPNFSVQGDAIYSDLGEFDESITNLTLHGIYNSSETVGHGLFIGQDTLDGEDILIYGVEGNYGTRILQFQWYLSQLDDDVDTATMFGADLWAEVAPTVLLGLHLDRINFGDDLATVGAGDTSFTTFAASARYDLNETTSIYAMVGNFGVDVGSLSGDEAYFTIGARFNFGPRAGTTMGYRSFENVLPGL